MLFLYDGDYGVAADIDQLTANAPQCLRDHLAAAEKACDFVVYPDNYDDCIFHYFAPTYDTCGTSDRAGYPIGPFMPAIPLWGGTWSTPCPGCAPCWYWHNAAFLLDQNCSSLQSIPAGKQLCDAGSLHWRGSPISLLLDPKADIEDDPTVACFPLEPGRPDRCYVWKASAQAPLVVYDPEHKGAITSAAQLFGLWTFGGKRSAALSRGLKSDVASAQHGPWRDGFEALSTLDRDGDGKLSGDEVADLGLWFDRNRNGRSEAGEVQRLTAAGIESLFFTVDSRDRETGSVLVKRGYERVVNGAREVGPAVDWYGEEADSVAEALQLRTSTRSLCSDPAQRSAADEIPPPAAANAPAADAKQPDQAENVSGLWEWQAHEVPAGAVEPAGYFTLSDKKNGAIFGHSWFEAAFRRTAGGASSTIQSYWLEGRKEQNADGRTILTFSIRQGESVLDNWALLSADGKELSGTTTAHAMFRGKLQTISYKWKARRVEKQS